MIVSCSVSGVDLFHLTGKFILGALLTGATFVCAAWLARYGLRHRIKMLLICVGLMAMGLVVYLLMGENPVGAICDSIHSFFPSRGDFRTVPVGQPCGPEWKCWQSVAYFAFHWLVLVYLLSIVLAIFGIELINWTLICFKVWRGRAINVFWDYGNESWWMAHSLKGNGDSSCVVFVLREENKAWFLHKLSGPVQSIAKEGWKWVFGAPGRHSELLHAKQHFFLSSNGHENVAGAEALISTLGNLKVSTGHVKVYVRVHAMANDDVVFKWADAWNRRDDNDIEIIILREEAIVSRNFLLQHPMLDCPTIAESIDTESATAQGELRILLVGFGGQGKTLLNDMVCDAQYLAANGTPLPIFVDVVDRSASSYGDYSTNNEDAVNRYNIKFHHMNTRGGRFWDWVREQLNGKGWNRIVICTKNDRENISVAMQVMRCCKWLGKETKGVLFARVREPHINAYAKKAMSSAENAFSVFGGMTDTYRYDAIVKDKWDLGAMMLNFRWSPKDVNPAYNTPEHKWKTASCFNRESSRASFFFQRNMLRLLGYRMDESMSDTTEFNPADVASHLDILARIEHLRWMAWHFVRGIKPFSNDMVGMYPKANQIETRNAHGDLIDFDKLPNPEKKKDINLVASDAWQRSGLGIRRA